MSVEDITRLQSLTERLHELAETFPDFRYAKISGEAVGDERIMMAVLNSLAAYADVAIDSRPADKLVNCVYGQDLDGAITELQVLADDVWLAVRNAMSHFGVDTATIPVVRETGPPFVLIETLLKMSIELPENLARQFEKLGVPPCPREGLPDGYAGKITVENDCLVFPGHVYALPVVAEATAEQDVEAYRSALAAANRGELSAFYSPLSVFKLISGYFDTCLMMDDAAPNAGEAMGAGRSNDGSLETEPDLIAPMEQAQMLGWPQPNETATLKRLATLRGAAIERGIKLDEQRVRGSGNKTYVPRAQWLSVVTLFEFTKANTPDEAQAVAAIARGELRNRSGKAVSYWCDKCAEVTRTNVAEPVCKKCGESKSLRPITRVRGK